MVVCPSCGSSRVRNDYKPAPHVLRLIGVRALLCDYCNRQFRAFSPAPPRNRNSRNTSRKPAVSNSPSRPLDTQVKPELEASRMIRSTEERKETQIKVDLTGIVSADEPQLANGNGGGSLVPIQPALRSEIAKLHDVRHLKETPGLNGKENHKSNATCPECGSNWVRRRQRSGLERVVFALTNHKAFICRSCDASFYARTGSEESESNILSRSAQT